MAAQDTRTIYQRIRYGLTGLAVVFLVVLLGAALRRMGEDSAPPPKPPVATDPNEPLAEIGAAPGQAQNENSAAAETKPAKKKPVSE